jgi:predicted nucleic acid-binding protein
LNAPVFVDTAAFIALISRDDAWHLRAREQFAMLAQQRLPLLTSSAVLFELLDGAAARGPMRTAAMRLVDSIRKSPQWRIVHVTEEHMREGESNREEIINAWRTHFGN